MRAAGAGMLPVEAPADTFAVEDAPGIHVVEGAAAGAGAAETAVGERDEEAAVDTRAEEAVDLPGMLVAASGAGSRFVVGEADKHAVGAVAHTLVAGAEAAAAAGMAAVGAGLGMHVVAVEPAAARYEVLASRYYPAPCESPSVPQFLLEIEILLGSSGQ